MADREGGQWNVSVKERAVHLERASEDGGQLFDALLEPEEARELAELLTKYADKVDESDDDKEDESDDDAKDNDD